MTVETTPCSPMVPGKTGCTSRIRDGRPYGFEIKRRCTFVVVLCGVEYDLAHATNSNYALCDRSSWPTQGLWFAPSSSRRLGACHPVWCVVAKCHGGRPVGAGSDDR